MLRNGSNDLRFRLATILQVDRPGSTRVQCVPLRPPLIPTPPAWIVVAKSVNDHIPERLVLGDEHLFCQLDPHRIENQPPTAEIRRLQILNSFDRTSMMD